jgi:hypothetical protein
LSPTPIADSVRRIAQEQSLLAPPPGSAALFRVTVEADVFVLPPPWYPHGGDAMPYRPRGGTSHHEEFLRAVTPEAFRGSALYPAGVSVDPVAVYNTVRSRWRAWQEQRIRGRIAKEVDALTNASQEPR